MTSSIRRWPPLSGDDLLYQEMTSSIGRWTLLGEDFYRKMTSSIGRWSLSWDDLYRGMTCFGRQPALKEDLSRFLPIMWSLTHNSSWGWVGLWKRGSSAVKTRMSNAVQEIQHSLSNAVTDPYGATLSLPGPYGATLSVTQPLNIMTECYWWSRYG